MVKLVVSGDDIGSMVSIGFALALHDEGARTIGSTSWNSEVPCRARAARQVRGHLRLAAVIAFDMGASIFHRDRAGMGASSLPWWPGAAACCDQKGVSGDPTHILERKWHRVMSLVSIVSLVLVALLVVIASIIMLILVLIALYVHIVRLPCSKHRALSCLGRTCDRDVFEESLVAVIRKWSQLGVVCFSHVIDVQ